MMRHWMGAALITATMAGGALIVWRLVRGVEWWLVDSGAGAVLGWSLVAALVLTFLALPAAAWGLAARVWLVRLEDGQRLEAAHHHLVGDWPRHPRQVDAEAFAELEG